jgi:GxxExxY protein
MRFDPTEYPHTDLTEQIIGAAMAVHRALGPGLNESIYKNSLCIELEERGIPFTQQHQFPVLYKAIDVGTLITDVIADNKVIVETKSSLFNYRSTHGAIHQLSLHFKTSSRSYPKLQESVPRVQKSCEHPS